MTDSFSYVILPDSGADLLRRELEIAFTRAGFGVCRVCPRQLQDPASPDYLPLVLERTGPSLFFSINFQGLSNLKQTLEHLKAGRSLCAVWCVDNPWNILAGVRDPRWKELPFFVTDESFLPGLLKHGAKKAAHLPLAGCVTSFVQFRPKPADEGQARASEDENGSGFFAFAGRLSFPGKDAFHEGARVEEPVMAEALSMLTQGRRPHSFWWEKKLGLGKTVLWPGKAYRPVSLGAEESNAVWRVMCAREAARVGEQYKPGHGLYIYGDSGWSGHKPENARLLDPVDYYAHLPAIYEKSRYSLAMTSMQLTRGLTQRHFDVWLCRGFCLTDHSGGLDIFPQELVRPIMFDKSAELGALVERLENNPARRESLQMDWIEHILSKHTYDHRVMEIVERCGM